jgi:hypothetical protein
MKKWMKVTFVAVAVVALLVVALLGFAVWMRFVYFPPVQARAILNDVSNLTERTVLQEIPQGLYKDAIFAGEYIQRYYPVGVILKADHPFAPEYKARREQQVQRIVTALAEATGFNCGTNWNEWRQRLGIPQKE